MGRNSTICCGNCHHWERQLEICCSELIDQSLKSTHLNIYSGSNCELFVAREKDPRRERLIHAMRELKRIRITYDSALIENEESCTRELQALCARDNLFWLDVDLMKSQLRNNKDAQIITSRWKESSILAKTHFMASKTALEEIISDLVDQVRVRRGTKYRLIRTYEVDRYKELGSMAIVYARAAAELEARAIAKKVPGIDVRTKFVSEVDTCEVWARVKGEVDVLVLQRMSGGLGLTDWLIACRELKVEPRVFLPFLPKGIEERLLDKVKGN